MADTTGGGVCLGGTGDRVLDESQVRGIDDGGNTSVLNRLWATSMVTPLSLSSLRESMTHANSKVAFPFSSAIFLYFSMRYASTFPVSASILPTEVDLPWST